MGEEEKKSDVTKTEEEEQPKEPAKIEDKGSEKSTEELKSEAMVPSEIVLKVFMHCEGCARKVRRSLKSFPGVEGVITDTKSQKVVVKGDKVDPLKVLERVQKKSHRRVELLSPIPKPPSQKEATKPPQEAEKPEEKKQEIVTVVLKIHMHCEACSQEIKRRILRMKGVESAEADLKNATVSVTGAIEASKLVDYVYKRTGRQAVIIKQEPQEESPKNQEEEPIKPKEEEAQPKKEEKAEKPQQEQGAENNKKEEEKKSGKEEEVVEEKTKQKEIEKEKDENNNNNNNKEERKETVNLTKNEYYYYPPRHGMELYAYAYNYNPPPPPPLSFPNVHYPVYYQNYPPHMFSDENPNACSVM
ncbi:hypothetical protein PIB30_081503 [Stylosanthes scabra]|uniref:HMA domain-containing protein n=1 Tax=Stylosanthes scabra TaxID=79078 RepID=A0ABU6RS06_9FABA|nr:hypothetical protein [Stylosanthes scabra]